MKKNLVLALILCLAAVALFTGEAAYAKNSCTTLNDEVIAYSVGHYLAGEYMTPGYDIFGYNYGAHMFKGSYANAYLGGSAFLPTMGMTHRIWRTIRASQGNGTGPIAPPSLS